MTIHGIFYARFLPQEGTKIVAQSPPGCIVPMDAIDESDDEQEMAAAGASGSSGAAGAASATGAFAMAHGTSDEQATASASLGSLGGRGPRAVFARGKALFDFDVMQEYVIPRPAFFNRYLAARDPSGRYAVLGLPVAIRDAKYYRNEFIFNFGIVVDVADDQGPYERVVRRLASTFAEMERQNEYLSREELRRRGGCHPGNPGSASTMGAGTAAPAATASGSTIPGPSFVGLGLSSGMGSSRLGPVPGSSGPASTSVSEHHPAFHSMTGAFSSSFAISSIDEFLDRRRHATGGGQSPPPVAVASTTMMSTTANDLHEGPQYRRSIQSLLEIIKEDLNLYGECMIPVDDANIINMKLFPQHPNPPVVEGWHVPVPKMRLADVVDPSWDLTLQRVIAHMDGVSDVRRIALEADISLDLCRAALRHLLYYDTILLLDMFFFGSCYAPRPGIHDFVANVGGIVDECARYVCLGGWRNGGDDGDEESDDDGDDEDTDDDEGHRPHGTFDMGSTSPTLDRLSRSRSRSRLREHDRRRHRRRRRRRQERVPRVSNFDLIRLMTSFCIGRTVTEWLKGHADAGFDVLRFVDVRRLVQFGIIKGLLYRVHKYVVSKQYLAGLVTGQARPVHRHDSNSDDEGDSKDHADHANALLRTTGDPLQKYTDGLHHFDQIITEQNVTEAELIAHLKRLPLPVGDLKILYR